MKLQHPIKLRYLAMLALGFSACETDIEREFPADASGSADFSVYVALGNSLTAGYADGMLNRYGQLNSYPAIIADKMAAVTPDFKFTQPLMPEGTINGTLQFHGLVNGLPDIRPKTDGVPMQAASATVSGVFQNLGVPDAKAADLTQTSMQTEWASLFFNRFAQPGKSLVQMATEQNPTFFTLWIGNNDILEYATFGGENNPQTAHTERITPSAEYKASMEAILTQLKQANSNIKGAIANIPGIEKIPYFNVVPWNAFVLESQAQVDQLTAGFAAQLNPAIRSQVILGVITEGARRQIISQVAPGVVKQQVMQANPDMTSEEADAYLQTAEGQALINNLIASLIDQKQPETVHALVLEKLNSAPVQSKIEQNFQGASEADANGQLAQAIGEEGAAQVEAIQAATIANFKAAGYYPTFQVGQNGFVVASNDSPTTLKQLGSGEKITLRFLSRTPEEFDPAAGQVVVPDKYALDAAEMARVTQAIADYNEIIADLALEHNLALVDMYAFLNLVTSTGGITVGGRTFSNAYITGNAFALDGAHLSQAGYALVAHKFIEAINSKYNAKLGLPDISRYPAFAIPNQ